MAKRFQMHPMKRMLVPICCFLVAVTMAPQGARAQWREEEQVALAVEKLRVAMVDADRKALEDLVCDELSYGHSSGQVDDKEAFMEKIVSGRSDFVSIELAEQTIRVARKTAIVRHVLMAKTNDNGQPGEVQLRVLLLWQERDGQWKLLARQAVKMTP
jgi:ketosteroid isomerase-like protein